MKYDARTVTHFQRDKIFKFHEKCAGKACAAAVKLTKRINISSFSHKIRFFKPYSSLEYLESIIGVQTIFSAANQTLSVTLSNDKQNKFLVVNS